jgi:hypothetical protein
MIDDGGFPASPLHKTSRTHFEAGRCLALQRLKALKRLLARSVVVQRLAQRSAEEIIEYGVFRSAVETRYRFHQLDLDVAGVMGRRRNAKLIDLRAHFITQPFGRPRRSRHSRVLRSCVPPRPVGVDTA